MRRDDALAILRREKARLVRDYGVLALGIFGSTARDEAGSESDVDVIVKLANADLFNLVHIRDVLNDAFGSEVDLVHEHKYMRPLFVQRIREDTIYV